MAPTSVMVVEDGENVRYVTSAALRSAGFEVDEQENGQRALRELLRVTPQFDLVVLDIMLPDLDGLELCRRLREERILASPSCSSRPGTNPPIGFAGSHWVGTTT